MAQAGTLLSDLDGSPGGGDGDLVQQILQDMNAQPSMGNPVVQSHQQQNYSAQAAPMPPMGARMPMQQAPPPVGSTYPQAADPAVPTAHMIGREHPTAADFNRMMMSAQAASAPAPYQSMQQIQMQQMQQQLQQQQMQMAESTKSWSASWIEEFKLPMLVAMVVLIVTLPAVNLLVSHYAPALLRPGGDLNTYGLIVRSLIAGSLFWFLQRVVAPLVAL